MHYLYSAGTHRNQKVIGVFVGGKSFPSDVQVDRVLMMDPEIEPPITVIPFGGMESVDAWDDNATMAMILSTTPRFADEHFLYRCTRIEDFILIKILVNRPVQHDPRGPLPYDYLWEITLN